MKNVFIFVTTVSLEKGVADDNFCDENENVFVFVFHILRNAGKNSPQALNSVPRVFVLTQSSPRF